MKKLRKTLTILLVMIVGSSSVPINVIGEAISSSDTASTGVSTKPNESTISSTTSTQSETASTKASTTVSEIPSPDSTNKQIEPKKENKSNPFRLEKEETPNILIDYKNEKLTGFDPAANYKMTCGPTELLVSSVSEYAITDDMMGMNAYGKDWNIVRLPRDPSKPESDPFKINIPMRDIISANYITIRHESEKGANDGQLQLRYKTKQIEYRRKGSFDWLTVEGDIVDNLPPDIYQARYKATDQAFASGSLDYEIKAGLEKEAMPDISVDYKKEILTGFDPAANYKMTWGTTDLLVSNVSEYAITDDMMGMNAYGKDWNIVRLPSDLSKQESDPFKLNIPMRDIISNNYVTAKDETYKGANDGQLKMNYDSYVVEYRKKEAEDWIPVEGMAVTGLSPDTYEVRYQATDKEFASISREYTIKAGLVKEVTSEIAIDFKDEKLTGFDPAAKYEMTCGNEKKSVSGTSEYKITEDMTGNNYTGKTWNIVRLPGDPSKQESDPFSLNIPMRDIISNNYVTAKDETFKGANDGQLKMNYDSYAVEYRKQGDEDWISVEGMAVTGLSPDTYEVRYQATDKEFASILREYTINAGLEKEVMPNISIDYKKELLTGFDPLASYKMTNGNTELLINRTSEYPITDEMMGATAYGKEWKIVRLPSDITKQESDSFSLNIPMRDIISNNYVTAKDETFKGANDGQLKMNFDSYAVEYRKQGAGDWIPVEGTAVTGLSPGTYEARYQATDKEFASILREYTIKAGLEKEVMPNISIDYKKELLTGFDSLASYKMTNGNTELLINHTSEYPITDEMMGATAYGKEWSIVRLPNDITKQESDPFKLNIPMRDIIASNYVTAQDETYKGANDGQLKMKYNSYPVEYRKQGMDDWIPVKGESVTGLSPGTYETRYQNTDKSFASISREYTIKEGPEKKDIIMVNPKELNLAAPLGYDSNLLKNKVIITNTGKQTITNLSIKESETAAFELENNDVTELAAGASTTFTIEPKAGLTIGTYKMNVEITSNNAITVKVPVTFEVFGQGKVIVRYQDDKGSEIVEPETQSGKLGDPYSTKQKEFEGYTFKEAQGNTSGIFSNQEQTVTYVYTKNEAAQVQKGNVTVNYVDEQGRKLADPEILSGKIGESYVAKQKNIKGYTLKEVQGNPKGSFSLKTQTITYVYKKTTSSIVANVNKPKNGSTSQRGSVNTNKTLLKAGDTINNFAAFLGLIILIFTSSVYLRRKYSKAEK